MDDERSRPARRLQVRWDGSRWAVDADIPLGAMTLPGSADLDSPTEGRIGFWYDVVDAEGAVAYRSVVHDPRPVVEAFDDDGTIVDVGRLDPEHGVLDLLVPDLPGGRVLLFADDLGGSDKEPLQGLSQAVLDVAIGTGAAQGGNDG